jgi:hypothetical protein
VNIVGKQAEEVKAKWIRMKMLDKIKRILVYEWKKTIWTGLTEKKAIEIFLRHENVQTKGKTLVEKKYIIIKMASKKHAELTKRSIRRPKGVGDYQLYLRSKEWQDRRQMMFELRGKKCELCGSFEDRLQIHHLHYRTLYKETSQDLMILCQNCHQHWHDVNNVKTAK